MLSQAADDSDPAARGRGACADGAEVTDLSERFCRICGYDLGEAGVRDKKYGYPTYNICHCCGMESGIDDVSQSERIKYRNEWIFEGESVWFNEKHKPESWNLREQMKNIPRSFKAP